MDETGAEVIPCVYADAEDFRNGVAEVTVRDDNLYHPIYIDPTGTEVDGPVLQYTAGLAVKGGWLIVNEQGQPLVADEQVLFSDEYNGRQFVEFMDGYIGVVVRRIEEKDETGELHLVEQYGIFEKGYVLAPIIFKEIGGTLYAVYGYFSPDARETAREKIRRLLSNEFESKKRENP